MKIWIILLSFILTSCFRQTNDLQTQGIKNDTTIILEQTLKLALVDSFIVDYVFLHTESDSVVFQIDSIKENLFPEIEGFRIKYKTKEAICQEVKQLNRNQHYPNYLKIKYFEYFGDSAVISLINTCVCIDWNDSLKCRHGFMCGGGFALIFNKENGVWTHRGFGEWIN